MRNPMVVAAVFALALGLAGCGEGGGGPEAGAAPSPVDREAQAVKYSQCMRDNGVPSFPDPVDGRIQLRVRPGDDLNPQSEAYKKAEEACKSLQPAGLGQGGPDGEQQAQMLKFAQCMRENGVPAFPDPQSDGRMVIGGPDSGVDPESPAFKQAQTKCRDLAPGGGL